MTRYIYPRNYELCKSAPVLARKGLIRAYEELGSISAVAKAFGTTRKTVRKVLRRWDKEGESGLKNRPRRPGNSPRRTSLAVEGMITAVRKETGYGSPRARKSNRPSSNVPIRPMITSSTSRR